jgi:hypothetical protein
VKYILKEYFMAFSATVIQDGSRYVMVRLNNSTGGAVASTKIIDASTLSYSTGTSKEKLKLIRVGNISESTAAVGGKIQFSDNTGAASGDKSLIVTSSVYNIPVSINNEVANSNGDVFFESLNATFYAELTFEKIDGYLSIQKKWNS